MLTVAGKLTHADRHFLVGIVVIEIGTPVPEVHSHRTASSWADTCITRRVRRRFQRRVTARRNTDCAGKTSARRAEKRSYRGLYCLLRREENVLGTANSFS